MEVNESLPDHLRCKRTDGRQWRCKRRVMEDKKLCEVHHIQGRHRQHKEKVPESLKLKREKNRGKDQDFNIQNRDIRGLKREKEGNSRPAKRRRKNVAVSEALDGALRKMKLRKGDLQLELIRVFLKRQVEKKKERELRKNAGSEREFTRELPYGLMEISPAFSPAFSEQIVNNASPCDIKLGIDLNSSPRRCFRSKNIEPIPISTMQIVPFARNAAKLRKMKRKKCHWCRKSSYRTLVKCLSCKKEHFCTDCINERLYVIQEVKLACPVCLKICGCRACLTNQSKDNEQEDISKNEKMVAKIQHLQYLIYMLLPVLEQINREQSIELDLEAKLRGCTISEIQIQQDEFSCNKLRCCNNCQTLVVDFHRSCRNCSYKLCLSCSEVFRGFSPRVKKAFISKRSNRSKSCKSGDKLLSKVKKISSSRQDSGRRYLTSPTISPKWKACNENGRIVCPPLAVGGCGDGLLDLSCVFPFKWAKELELSANKFICSYNVPETLDASSCCSLCKDNKACQKKMLQGAASREDSSDNSLYYPTVKDLSEESVGHFQKHWRKGQPVIVRRVVKSRPDLSWDPVVMVCTYLEKSINKSQNDKEATKATKCLDWCEIEICRKKIFMGSLEGRSQANMCYDLLKLKFWLSSFLLQEQFPDHYTEIIHALPLPEYMNPMSALLNLAANLPKDTAKQSLGPCLCISFGCPDDLMQPDFLTKLSYDSHDMVNILVHTTDVPISSEQLTKIKNLTKQCRSQDNTSRNNVNEKTRREEKSALLSGNTEESGLQDIMEEGLRLPDGGNNTSTSHDEGHDSESESEASILCSGITQSSEDSDDQHFFRDHTKSSSFCGEKQDADSCGAQWDIFRRQDVPKLLEYLSRHSNEFSQTYCFPQNVIHPILDQRFYLDVTHKIRLKEEFNIEPWTFEQHLGEAVMVPAGCPYQIRKKKSCVNVILDFISPENAKECINLIDERRLLPVHHKARKNVMEVKNMTICSISAAVKEMSNLKGAIWAIAPPRLYTNAATKDSFNTAS